MFFYVSLFIACVISAFLVLYLYNALTDVGKAVYRALLPSSKGNRSSRSKKARFNSTVNKTASPWGWKGNDNRIREHGSKGAALEGASGLEDFINKYGKESAALVWPHREEKTESVGKSYKVSRKAGSVKTSRSSGGKPWGW